MAATIPPLSDGIIFIRSLTHHDAPDHLAGEDDEIIKWLSGGRSNTVTVAAYIERSLESWQNSGPVRPFGGFDCATCRLIGSIEANLARSLESGQPNLSYSIFRQWRRQGMALRAIDLMGEYLHIAREARQMVLRISPDNVASMKLAERSGFTPLGVFEEPEGPMARFIRDLRQP